MSTLISLFFLLFALPQHNRPYLIWLIKSELSIKNIHLKSNLFYKEHLLLLMNYFLPFQYVVPNLKYYLLLLLSICNFLLFLILFYLLWLQFLNFSKKIVLTEWNRILLVLFIFNLSPFFKPILDFLKLKVEIVTVL